MNQKIAIVIIILIVCVIIGGVLYFTSNNNNQENENQTANNTDNTNISETENNLTEGNTETEQSGDNLEAETGKTLVVYFSAQNHTEAVAEKIAERIEDVING